MVLIYDVVDGNKNFEHMCYGYIFIFFFLVALSPRFVFGLVVKVYESQFQRLEKSYIIGKDK